MSKIANVLKSLRIKEGLTQGELADKTGLSRSAISMYEQGKRVPPADILELFADFYNVDMNYITGRSDEEYYLDLQTRQIAQQLLEREDLKILFDATKDISPDDVKYIKELVDRLKNQS